MTGLTACRVCGQVHQALPLAPGRSALCRRCGARLEKRSSHSLHRTAALALSAIILYMPANLLPIMRLELYGASSENTVLDGCIRLYRDGDLFVAAIVFLASIVIPLLKLLGLLYLVTTNWLGWSGGLLWRTRVYRVIESVGRWAMLDVFVLAILVSIVKLRGLATVIPGPGLFSFTLVVVFTLLASASFDSQLIWEKQESRS